MIQVVVDDIVNVSVLQIIEVLVLRNYDKSLRKERSTHGQVFANISKHLLRFAHPKISTKNLQN